MKNPRSKKSQGAYARFKKKHKDNKARLEHFEFADETILREFKHWIIIESRFPYDNVASVNDLLISKRPIGRHYDGTQAEEKEYHTIMKLLASEGYYDALIENFPKSKSVKKFAHTHLVIWQNTKKSQSGN